MTIEGRSDAASRPGPFGEPAALARRDVTTNADERRVKSEGEDTETRLREATVQFEAVFVQQMLAAMRSTIPEGGAIDGGHGEDMWASVLDEHLEQLMAGESRGGLADALYRQLTRGVGR